MSLGLRRDSGISIIITYLYRAIVAAIFVGIASFIYTSFQPTRLPNPGMTAYRVPAALVLYPLPSSYASPEPELAADADPLPVLSPTAVSGQQVQRGESPKGPAPKKSKQAASRPHALRNKYFMTNTQFHSYGYFRPW
jgi:hypothetical protein